MRQALLAVTKGCSGGINIGDYIQALASKQFLSEADIFIERETELSTYNDDPVVMIMNGWYMNHPENWPPSPRIHPIFVSLHINHSALPLFLEKDSIIYLKKHEPIGCRDTHSVKLLREKGVKAYFSGCMTLTLGYKYKSIKRTDKVYIVEPPVRTNGLWASNKLETVKNLVYTLLHFQDAMLISKKKKETGLKRIFYNAFFLKQYSRVFDYSMLVKAEYINQYNEDIIKEYPTNDALLGYAEELVKKYAEASCVITSRIHCALPCLGLETPVIFVKDENMHQFSADRMGGVMSLFNVISWDGFKLTNNLTKSKISVNNFPINKQDYKDIACNLKETCLQGLKDILKFV